MLQTAMRFLLRSTAPKVPIPLALEGPSGEKIYKMTVPYRPSALTWAKQVKAIAPGTHPKPPALSYGEDFAVPAVPASGSITIVLAKSSWFDTSEALKSMEERRLIPASPYHLFALHRHVGDIQHSLGWQNSRGPGILATERVIKSSKAGNVGFSLWYPSRYAPCRASVAGLGDYFGALTLYAFIDNGPPKEM
jgi:hypothetical protein